MIGLRQQLVMTLILMPITFALWIAAAGLLAGPAAWLAGFILEQMYAGIVASAALNDTLFIVSVEFGNVNGKIVTATEAGHELVFEVNTQLLSYSIPFYAALLWSSKLQNPANRFALGLFALWFTMALGLIAIVMKDLMLVVGAPFLAAPGIPPGAAIALLYQFSVLLAPTLLPVLLWLTQLQGTPLWTALQQRLIRDPAA